MMAGFNASQRKAVTLKVGRSADTGIKTTNIVQLQGNP